MDKPSYNTHYSKIKSLNKCNETIGKEYNSDDSEGTIYSMVLPQSEDKNN